MIELQKITEFLILRIELICWWAVGYAPAAGRIALLAVQVWSSSASMMIGCDSSLLVMVFYNEVTYKL